MSESDRINRECEKCKTTIADDELCVLHCHASTSTASDWGLLHFECAPKLLTASFRAKLRDPLHYDSIIKNLPNKVVALIVPIKV
jgi:hypothetical protein